MEETANLGIIYSVKSRTTGKTYIGQTKEFKYKDGKPYSYGIDGRWGYHVLSKDDTPLHRDMREYGVDDFIIEEVGKYNLGDIDYWEAKTIKERNTLVPLGYNVAKHSRVKNRESNIYEFYLETALSIELTPIKKDGVNSLVYIYIKENNVKERTRLTFGQGENSSYQSAVVEALDFAKKFQDRGIEVLIHPDITNLDDPLSKYYKKITEYNSKEIFKISVTKNKHGEFYIIVVFIHTRQNISNREADKICFGGKSIDLLDAYNTANSFIQRIKKERTIIEITQNLKKFLKSATGSCLSE